MTIQTVVTETFSQNYQRPSIVDTVESSYLHAVRFLYGAWTSPYVWLIFGIALLVQTSQNTVLSVLFKVLAVAFILNVGRLWKVQDIARKNYVRGLSNHE